MHEDKKIRQALCLNGMDDVACVLENTFCGDEVVLKDSNGHVMKKIQALENIPRFHKIALKSMPKGSYVHKYGEVIGVASVFIKQGEHVHIHNIMSLKVGV
jgi:altronate dehydratase